MDFQNGSLQMYNLGSKLRQRYLRLIPSDSLYSPDHMFAMSSGAERCIMSGQSFFAGFLPPSAEVNNLPIVWQPVPITIIPRDRDDVTNYLLFNFFHNCLIFIENCWPLQLIAQKRACEKYDRLLAQMYTQNTTEDLKDVAIKYANIFTYLTKHTGEVSLKDTPIFWLQLSHCNEIIISGYDTSGDRGTFVYNTVDRRRARFRIASVDKDCLPRTIKILSCKTFSSANRNRIYEKNESW